MQFIVLAFSLHLDLPGDAPKLFNQLQRAEWESEQDQLLGTPDGKAL